jgi:hypothetical protein
VPVGDATTPAGKARLSPSEPFLVLAATEHHTSGEV